MLRSLLLLCLASPLFAWVISCGGDAASQGAGGAPPDTCEEYGYLAEPCKDGLECPWGDVTCVGTQVCINGAWKITDRYCHDTTTTTGTMVSCDSLGGCDSLFTGSCPECAISAACANAYNNCVGNTECTQFYSCIDACTDGACIDTCIMTYPEGTALYDVVASCILCGECPVSCSDLMFPCP